MVTFGDSKTARSEWQPLLITSLRSAGLDSIEFGNAGRNGAAVVDSLPGSPGTGIDILSTGLPQRFLHTPELVGYVLMNWGVNDMQSWPLNEELWEAQYGILVDWAHEKFPNAKIYLSYPWRVGYDSIAATMRGWVDDIIAAHSDYTFPGVDEAVTIKGNDNGWSETDASTGGAGVHYTPLGVQLYAEAMQTVLGF